MNGDYKVGLLPRHLVWYTEEINTAGKYFLRHCNCKNTPCTRGNENIEYKYNLMEDLIADLDQNSEDNESRQTKESETGCGCLNR